MGHAGKRTPDHAALYHLAEQQAEYFTARHVAKAGFSWERLTEYSKNGRFQRVAHGIYRLAQVSFLTFRGSLRGLAEVWPAVCHLT
jgi:predicted transcriptional regulator of viral defense system